MAEVIGTFIVVVLATGSVVLDAKSDGTLGLLFVAFVPFIDAAIAVYLFGKISMAHFNPAVSVALLITWHITMRQFAYYLGAEIIGALLGNLFVMRTIGSEVYLGADAPNYSYPLPILFGIEALATALVMAVIYVVVYAKGLKGFNGIVIGGIVGLDIFFLAFISGASMNSYKGASSCHAFRRYCKPLALLDGYLYRNCDCCLDGEEKIQDRLASDMQQKHEGCNR